MIRAALLSLLLVAPLWAQSRELDVSPTDGWADTGVDVRAGDTLQIGATGQLQYANAAQANGPAGLARGAGDASGVLPLNDAGRGALIGRIGSNSAARPFLIGEQTTTKATMDGRLFLAINQSAFDESAGAYHVTILRTAAAANPSSANVTVPFFPKSLMDSIPTRVSDPNGAPGDRVNFIIIGSQEQMQAAFKAAGWVVVDRTDREAVMSGMFGSYSKEAYLTMPVSELRLFGRPQDFGYAQADPLRVVASRHDFRIWKAPDQLDGLTVWAGAGTHDIGFDRDQHNNVTHRIDPDTDAERDYIRDSLMQTGLVLKAAYVTPTDPVREGKSATGGAFHSDGRTLLIYLAGASGDVSSASAAAPK